MDKDIGYVKTNKVIYHVILYTVIIFFVKVFDWLQKNVKGYMQFINVLYFLFYDVSIYKKTVRISKSTHFLYLQLCKF